MANYTSSHTGAQIDLCVDTYQNATQVQALIDAAKLAMFPVGSIYISTTATNPSTFIGGTWIAFATGRTLIGVGTGTDDNSVKREFGANVSAGEYTHTLDVTEMPSHKHAYQEYRAGEVGYVPANSHANSITVRTDVNGISNTGGTLTDRPSGYYYNGSLIQNTGGGARTTTYLPMSLYICGKEPHKYTKGGEI